MLHHSHPDTSQGLLRIQIAVNDRLQATIIFGCFLQFNVQRTNTLRCESKVLAHRCECGRIVSTLLLSALCNTNRNIRHKSIPHTQHQSCVLSEVVAFDGSPHLPQETDTHLPSNKHALDSPVVLELFNCLPPCFFSCEPLVPCVQTGSYSCSAEVRNLLTQDRRCVTEPRYLTGAGRHRLLGPLKPQPKRSRYSSKPQPRKDAPNDNVLLNSRPGQVLPLAEHCYKNAGAKECASSLRDHCQSYLLAHVPGPSLESTRNVQRMQPANHTEPERPHSESALRELLPRGKYAHTRLHHALSSSPRAPNVVLQVFAVTANQKTVPRRQDLTQARPMPVPYQGIMPLGCNPQLLILSAQLLHRDIQRTTAFCRKRKVLTHRCERSHII